MDPEARQEMKGGRAGLTIEARQPARQHVTSRTVSGGDAPPDTSVADALERVSRAVEAAHPRTLPATCREAADRRAAARPVGGAAMHAPAPFVGDRGTGIVPAAGGPRAPAPPAEYQVRYLAALGWSGRPPATATEAEDLLRELHREPEDDE